MNDFEKGKKNGFLKFWFPIYHYMMQSQVLADMRRPNDPGNIKHYVHGISLGC